MNADGQPETTGASPRGLADEYLDALVELDPTLASNLGVAGRHDELADLSPAGLEARADLARSTLAALDRLTAVARDGAAAWPQNERRCARLLRERGEAVGLRPNFSIFDTSDQHRLLKEVLHDEDIGNVLEVPAALTTLILDGLRA